MIMLFLLLVSFAVVFVIIVCLFGPHTISRYFESPQRRLDLPEGQKITKLLAQYDHKVTMFKSATTSNNSVNTNLPFLKVPVQYVFTRQWFPNQENPWKAVVITVHGLNEHSGRLIDITEKMLQIGFSVCHMDHLGFGRSDGRFGFIEDFDCLVEDIRRYILEINCRFPKKKIFLLGNSMGACIILHVIMKSKFFEEIIDGIVLQAPMLEIHANRKKVSSPYVLQVGSVLRQFIPKLPILKSNNGKGSSPSVRDEVQKTKQGDPLYYTGKLRLGTAINLLQAVLQVEKQQVLTSRKPCLFPYLIQHGTHDQVCAIRGSENFHRDSGSLDKTILRYETGGHDLLHEPKKIKSAVINDCISWLVQRM